MNQPYGLCEFGHQGLQLDELSGIYDNRARIYIAYIGLFGQKDPIGTGDGMNMYQYEHGVPADGVDPLGLDSMTDAITMIIGSASFQTGHQNLFSALDKATANWSAGQSCGDAQDTILYHTTISGAVYDPNSLLYNIYHQLTIGSYSVLVDASAQISQKCGNGQAPTVAKWSIIYTCNDKWHLHFPVWDPGYWRTWQW